MDLIKQGIEKGLISFDDDKKYITYLHQNKRRNYEKPEEKVQAETYCALILEYGYPKHRVQCFVTVPMGVDRKEADIVVYNDDACQEPHILVECKKEDISEPEFKEAINQAYSYAFAMARDIKWVWVTSKIKNTFFQVDKNKQSREIETDIPAYGVDRIAPYKFVKGADTQVRKQGQQKFSELQIVSEDELTRRFKQAHNALWGGGQLNPSEAFDELDKLIFCKIWDERKPRKIDTPYDFQIIKEQGVGKTPQEVEADALKKTNAKLFERITELYEEGRKKDPEVFRDNIRLTPERARTIVEYLQDINLNKTDLDSKGRAFETFMDSFFRGSFGQYFTPRPIVKFIVDVLPITHDSLVLDTSCGSGGFLLHALEKVRQEASEFYEPTSTEHWKHWHEFAEKKLYGIEINEQISRAAKMNMIIHDDGHTNVITADGLLTDTRLQAISKNLGFQYGRFDFIITNPPFGSAVKLTEQAYLQTYSFGQKDTTWLDLKNSGVKNRDTQSTEVLFIEQCHQFLTEGGYLAIVIPDGVLTNSSLQYVRDQIEDWYRIVAVVSLPQTAFTHTGAGVKSSVLFLRKNSAKTTEKLQTLKRQLQDAIKRENRYQVESASIEKTKKHVLDNAIGAEFSGDLKEFKKTEQYKQWKSEKTAEFTEQLNELKERLEEMYMQRKQGALPDYSIFMAIAEDIGYDATNKPTGTNELEVIGAELARFIREEVSHESI
ncbi:restriction endonuclease subunit M [Thiothrix nivea]|uniref:N-6 DNA methylase n=1 Tax=Thiothrix nivea (strain ATCC 35100 / DSM 5205 / JP2) TaxID=870187 RepID=A0A656HGK4_THINJ|nr:N-6 DNA methylase [Thiothrix nivea]EIJ34520.1 N-6 DNA methylase [Thiothrix nivea DSM 5205]